MLCEEVIGSKSHGSDRRRAGLGDPTRSKARGFEPDPALLFPSFQGRQTNRYAFSAPVALLVSFLYHI